MIKEQKSKYNCNSVSLYGEVMSNKVFAHKMFGESFYYVDIKVNRQSNNSDIIPILISDRVIKETDEFLGMFVRVKGQFRSFNRSVDGKNLLVLHVFADVFEVVGTECTGEDCNEIKLEGFICKSPNYRKTPLDKEVCDVLLAVNRSYKKSDYIPCITWGRNAKFMARLAVSTKVKVLGRIQSREYNKKDIDGVITKRTAYEVSIFAIEINQEV